MAIGIDVMVALALLYFLITCGILLVKLRALNSLPYDRYQGAIVFYRLQVLYCLCCLPCVAALTDAPVTPAVAWGLVNFLHPFTSHPALQPMLAYLQLLTALCGWPQSGLNQLPSSQSTCALTRLCTCHLISDVY